MTSTDITFSFGRRCVALVTGILLTAFSHVEAGIINAISASLTDVSSAVASAVDGDTVVVPAGTASWTSTLVITKGITLQGATTTTGLTSAMTANDQTVLLDNFPRNGSNPAFVHATLTSGQTFRLTGFTFTNGTATTLGGGAVRVDGTCPSVRIDHCHFASLFQDPNVLIRGQIYGVFDHSLMDLGIQGAESFNIYHDTWVGLSTPPSGYLWSSGDGSWNDYPYFGTNQFFFIEDNFFNRSATGTGGGLDCYGGGRYVARYNYWTNTGPNSHGTESSGRFRGARAMEIYNNTFNYVGSNLQPGGLRSGTMLYHDNTWTGTNPGPAPHINNYRAEYQFLYWGGANGSCIIDSNDTTDHTGNGFGGGPNGLYASGTATNVSAFTFSVTGVSYVPNQWIGYEVTNTTQTVNAGAGIGYPLSTYIVGNTSNTITISNNNNRGSGQNVNFQTGDHFVIYKPLIALDQPGRGKGNLITAANPVPVSNPTGTVPWPNQALEPVYIWNNIFAGNGSTVNANDKGEPTIKANRDYYNLGAGLGSGTPSQVSSTYGAALNGVNYTGPYVYPHPLVSGMPSAPTNLRVAAQ
jgi:hypothetical protein